jgi:predicted transporter
MASILRTFEPEHLLTPVSRRVRLVAAGVCAAICLAFLALCGWLAIAFVRNGGVNAVPILLVGTGFVVIAVVFGVVAHRLAQDRKDRSPSSVSRGLYVAAVFFGTMAVLAAIAEVVMRDYDHLGAVIGSSFLAVLSYGCGQNASKRERENGAT